MASGGGSHPSKTQNVRTDKTGRMPLTSSIVAFILFVLGTVGCATPSPAPATMWSVRGSEGFDALCALNVLSEDPYYAEFYPAELRVFQSKDYDDARNTAQRLRAVLKDENGTIISAFLTLIFSGGPDASLDGLIESARQPEALRAAFERSPFWSAESWSLFERVQPDVVTTLAAMKRAGFREWWAREFKPTIDARAAGLRRELSRYDVLGEQRRLTGRDGGDAIEVIVLHFSEPHGIRIQGQRFLTHASYPAEIVLRNAAHEPLHPMLDLSDPRVRALVDHLGDDPLIASAVARHDPSYGYNSVAGLAEEDVVQALEQIVSERLGFADDPRERWIAADDGMHVLAAALYDLVRETNYPEKGGVFVDWLIARQSASDLSPAEIEKRARRRLGNEAIDKWLRAAPVTDPVQ